MDKIITVDFHGDTLFAVRHEGGLYVATTPICEAIGLNAERQRDRIKRDPILSEGSTMVVVPSAGGPQETFCLRLDLVSGWLFTLDESRIKDEAVKARVLAYKRECYRVLHEHFYGRQRAPEPVLSPIRGESLNLRRQLVAEARQTFGNQSARELWFNLDLPTVPAMYAGTAPDLFTYSYTAVPARQA